MISKSNLGKTIADWLINIKNGFEPQTVYGPFKLSREENKVDILVEYIGNGEGYILYNHNDIVIPVDRIFVGKYNLSNPSSLDIIYNDMLNFPTEHAYVCFSAKAENNTKGQLQDDTDYSWSSNITLYIKHIAKSSSKDCSIFSEMLIYSNFKLKPYSKVYLLTIRYSQGDSFGTGTGYYVFAKLYKTHDEAMSDAKALEDYYRSTKGDHEKFQPIFEKACPSQNDYYYDNRPNPDLTIWGDSFECTEIHCLEVK